MHFVRDARYVGGHTLVLRFEDGTVRRVDLEPHLDGEIFEPLRDLSYFRTVRVHPDLDTIVWDHGADFSPDSLYEIGEEVDEAELAASEADARSRG